MTKLNAIHNAKGTDIKEVSEASNDAVATVSKDAAVVGILNKVSESNLIKDLAKIAETQGGEAHAIISSAEAPVKLDASDFVQPDAPKAPKDLFGPIEGMTNSFGDFGKLGFERFGVVALKPDDNEHFDFGASKGSDMPDAEDAAGFASGFAHDDSAFDSGFNLALGGSGFKNPW